MEYTLTVIGFGIFLAALDKILQTRVLVRNNTVFWKTAAVFFVFQLVFDNLFTLLGVWSFNSAETLGIFVPFIPIENLIYGQELLAFTIILYRKLLSK